MKTQLILLDQPIIISDDGYNKPGIYFNTHTNKVINIINDEIAPFTTGLYFKVIAGYNGLPSIDYNQFEEAFGIIDIEKIARIEYLKEYSICNYGDYDDFPMYLEGFKKALFFKPKIFDIEIEMEIPGATYGHSGWHKQPKIENNKIKIKKIIK